VPLGHDICHPEAQALPFTDQARIEFGCRGDREWTATTRLILRQNDRPIHDRCAVRMLLVDRDSPESHRDRNEDRIAGFPFAVDRCPPTWLRQDIERRSVDSEGHPFRPAGNTEADRETRRLLELQPHGARFCLRICGLLSQRDALPALLKRSLRGHEQVDVEAALVTQIDL